MKKLILGLTILVLLFSICACSSMPPTDCHYRESVTFETPDGEVITCTCYYGGLDGTPGGPLCFTFCQDSDGDEVFGYSHMCPP